MKKPKIDDFYTYLELELGRGAEFVTYSRDAPPVKLSLALDDGGLRPSILEITGDPTTFLRIAAQIIHILAERDLLPRDTEPG